VPFYDALPEAELSRMAAVLKSLSFPGMTLSPEAQVRE
jgi:hypothetical protein